MPKLGIELTSCQSTAATTTDVHWGMASVSISKGLEKVYFPKTCFPSKKAVISVPEIRADHLHKHLLGQTLEEALEEDDTQRQLYLLYLRNMTICKENRILKKQSYLVKIIVQVY